MSDFTDGATFANYLSSFWSQIFSSPELIQGVGDSFSRELAQYYQDFVETVNACSVSTIDPYHTEILYPIFIRKSTYSSGPQVLTFGAGAVYGPQPANSTFRQGQTMEYGEPATLAPFFYAPLPKDVVGGGAVLLNRLYNPSVVLVAGSDFAFDEGVVIFREDIFANSLVPQRTVPAADGSVDQEIVLWATSVQLEQFNLYRQYGYLFLNKSMSGPSAKIVLEAIFRLFSGGPTISFLDGFVAAAMGLPVTAEDSETVVSIGQLGTSQVVVTDTGVYQIPPNLSLRASVSPGAVLTAGTPLTSATLVWDRFTNPLWWSTVDALMVDQNFVVSSPGPLGFINQDVQVTFDAPILVDGVEQPLCRFYLAGLRKNVDAFWKQTEIRSVSSQSYLAPTLWTKAGLVDGGGNPDYTQELFVNPLRILNDLIGDNLVVVQINEIPSGSLLPTLKLLYETIPAYCALVVLLNISVTDCYSMVSSSEDAVNPTTFNFVDPAALYNNSVSSFDSTTKGYWQNTDTTTGELLTKTPEALSSGMAPDILVDTIDLTSGAGSVSESVTGRLEKTC